MAYQALLRDHVTRRVRGNLTIPADMRATPELRAVALAPLVPARGVVGRQAAVWIHTGSHAPTRVAVLVGPRVRRPDPHPERTTHECELSEEDVVLLEGVRVTSVQRTGLDVARWFPVDKALDLLLLLSVQGFDALRGLARLDQLGGYAGIRDARTTLARLELAKESGPDHRMLDRLGAGEPVHVEDAVDLADGREHRGQVGRLGHLEHEAGQRHAVARGRD